MPSGRQEHSCLHQLSFFLKVPRMGLPSFGQALLFYSQLHPLLSHACAKAFRASHTRAEPLCTAVLAAGFELQPQYVSQPAPAPGLLQSQPEERTSSRGSPQQAALPSSSDPQVRQQLRASAGAPEQLHEVRL